MQDLRTSECKYGKAVRREWAKFKKDTAPLFDDIEIPPVLWSNRMTRGHGYVMLEHNRLTGKSRNVKIVLTSRFKHPRATMESFKHTLVHEFIHLLVPNHGPRFRRIAGPLGIERYSPHDVPKAK